MKQKKEKRITFRVTEDEHERIVAKANTAQMSTGTYVRAAALKHKVTIIDGLREIIHELKGIGRSLNQLATLANMGRITVVHLDDVMELLKRVYEKLFDLTEQERR